MTPVRLFALTLGGAHLLACGHRRQDGSNDPHGIFALRNSHALMSMEWRQYKMDPPILTEYLHSGIAKPLSPWRMAPMRLIVPTLGDAHLLSCGQRRQNGSTDPHGVLALRNSHTLISMEGGGGEIPCTGPRRCASAGVWTKKTRWVHQSSRSTCAQE